MGENPSAPRQAGCRNCTAIDDLVACPYPVPPNKQPIVFLATLGTDKTVLIVKFEGINFFLNITLFNQKQNGRFCSALLSTSKITAQA